MKNKAQIILLVVAILLLSFPLLVFAHSGRTDSNGGHTDHSTGEYHYHHGYPAHQHPNGVCPYKSNNSTMKNNYDFGDIIGIVIAVALALFCTASMWVPLVVWIYECIKKFIQSLKARHKGNDSK